MITANKAEHQVLSFSLRLKNNHIVKFSKPCVMGIINCSPDSFYQPQLNLTSALQTAETMINDGALILDIGGEATNPAVNLQQKISVEEEIKRVIPVIEALVKRFDVLISVDTSHANVMRAAINAGATIINDQRGLADEKALALVVKELVPVCLMHFFNPPRIPQASTKQQLLQQIKNDLVSNIQRCLNAGIQKDRIIIDPGFGGGNYGKDTAENFYLLSHLPEFTDYGYPVLTGLSRKMMIGEALGGKKVDERLYGSVSAAVIAALKGAAIIRTHDVKETVDALKVVQHMQIAALNN